MGLKSIIRGLILDMDGVLWQGDQPIGDLAQLFERINAQKSKVVLATNNSTRSVDQYVEKLSDFGVILERWQIITSSIATANYLERLYPKGGPVYIVGEAGLVSALEEKGFYPTETGGLAVIAGLDRDLTYDKLKRATLLVRQGAKLIGTNSDRTLPTPQGLIPGAGAVLSALETATDQKAIIIGKPAPYMYQFAMERLGTSPGETLAVGDRLETDIAGGQVQGCRTALVLSGVTTLEQARMWHPAPDLVAEDLTALLEQLWPSNV
jgi:4-nitrophenyl phosphatase